MGNKNHKHKIRECPCCCNCIREEPKKYTLLSYNPEEPKCKIGVLGDSKTGKTCFCNRLAYNNYNDYYDDTYSVSIISYKTTFKLKEEKVVDIDIELNDNPSKENMKALIKLIIIGNKSDRFLFGMVPESEAKEFAIKNNFLFFITSCLYGKDVESKILQGLFVNN